MTTTTDSHATRMGLILIALAAIAVLLLDAARREPVQGTATRTPIPVMVVGCVMPEDLDR